MFNLKKDKFTLIFFLTILILGIFIRFHNFGEEGLWNDDMTGTPTALLWFYPTQYYPGLSGQGEPALGNFFVGLGCIASGEDFSGVSKTAPMFYPGREVLFGEALVNAHMFCRAPMYIFGILFFIVISILAFSLLDKKSALYFISFFAFWPFILKFSRWIHVEIILYTFVAAGLLFLWKAYKVEKKTKKEILFFVLSFIFFGLSFGVKFPAALWFLFAIFIILEKYKHETLATISKIFNLKLTEKETKIGPLIKILTFSIISFIFFWLIGFKFSIKNFFAVLNKYKSVGGPEFSKLFNTDIFNTVYRFLIQISTIDLIFFIFSFYILIRLIFKKQKSKNEKFILYLAILFWVAVISTTAMKLTRVLVIYFIGLLALISLAFSDKEYSLFHLFKIKNKKPIFAIFLIIYIVFSFTIVAKDAPYFSLRNKILCRSEEGVCKADYASYYAKTTANYLKSVLQENETFMLMEGIIFYYLRREQGLFDWNFEQAFQQKFGRRITFEEKLKYFKPSDRTVRYLLVNPKIKDNDFTEDVIKIVEKYQPNKVIKIRDMDAVWIYDLFNMTPR